VIPDSVVKAKQIAKDEMNVDSKLDSNNNDTNDIAEEKPAEIPFWMRGWSTNEWKEKYLLKNPDWKLDPIPELIDGKNIADFIDPDILARLEELEQDEESREAAVQNEMDQESDDDFDLDEDELELAKQIKLKKKMIVQKHRREKDRNTPRIPRKFQSDDVGKFESHLAELGIDPSEASQRLRERSRSRSLSRQARKRARSQDADSMDVDDAEEGLAKKARKAGSRSRSRSKTPAQEGLKSETQRQHVQVVARRSQKPRNREAKKGEADRTVLNMKPKHLFSGKRKASKTDRR